jgi:hypothetical protein
MKILNSDVSKEKRDEGGRWTAGSAQAKSERALESSEKAYAASRATTGIDHREKRERIPLQSATKAVAHAENGNHQKADREHADASLYHDTHANEHIAKVKTAKSVAEANRHREAVMLHGNASRDHQEAMVEHRGMYEGWGKPDISKTRAPQGMTPDEQRAHLEKTFDEAAKKHLGIDTLKTRGSDSLDFHDVSVGGVKRALEHAYKAGQEAGKTAPTPAPKAKSAKAHEPTLDQKIASLKPGETTLISKGANGTHVTAERTGDGRTVKYFRHDGNTSALIKQHAF